MSERLAARDDGNFVQRIRMLGVNGHNRVTGLVESCNPNSNTYIEIISSIPRTSVPVLLLVWMPSLQTGWSHENAVACLVQMPKRDVGGRLAGSFQRCLVHHVFDVRSREADCSPGQF
jgi:hypothetical protein